MDPCVKTSPVDTCVVGSRDLLVTTLTDIVTYDFCLRERTPSERCIEGMLSYVRSPRDENTKYTLEILRGLIKANITNRITKPYLDFVLVKENLTSDEIREIETFNYEGVMLVGGNLYINPISLKDPAFVSAKLQTLFALSAEQADFLVKKRPLRYVKILRRMNLATKDFVDIKLQEEKLALQKGLITPEVSMGGFLILEPNPTRFFPEKSTAGQLTGFVDSENIGRYGVEAYFNDYLQGQ